MRTEFKIAGKEAPFRLFPLPVIKDEKFLIEVNTIQEAQLLLFLLKKQWVEIDPESPASLWKELAIHQDGQTQRFAPDWGQLRINYLPGEPNEKTKAVEAVLSRLVAKWVEAPYSEQAKALKELEQKIKAQLNCKSCQSYGIGEVDFGGLLATLKA